MDKVWNEGTSRYLTRKYETAKNKQEFLSNYIAQIIKNNKENEFDEYLEYLNKNNISYSFNFSHFFCLCFRYSMPIFYKLYDLYIFKNNKLDISFVDLINKNIKNLQYFYENESINGLVIEKSCYLRLFNIIKREIKIKNKEIKTKMYEDGCNVIEGLVLFLKNKTVYENYFYNLLDYFDSKKLCVFIKIFRYDLCFFDWSFVLQKLLEINIYNINNSSGFFNLMEWKIYFKILLPIIETHLDPYLIKTIVNTNHLNSFFALKNNFDVVLKLDNYIDYKAKDEGDFSLVHDCARYGGFKTFKFLLAKDDILNILGDITYDNKNIISCAILNSNNKILEYLLEFLRDNYVEYLKECFTTFKITYNQILECTRNYINKTINKKSVFRKLNILFEYADKFGDKNALSCIAGDILVSKLNDKKMGNFIMKKKNLRNKISISLFSNHWNISNEYQHLIETNDLYLYDFIDFIKIDKPECLIRFLISNLCIHNTSIFEYGLKIIKLQNKKISITDSEISTAVYNIISKCNSTCNICSKNSIQNIKKNILYFKDFLKENINYNKAIYLNFARLNKLTDKLIELLIENAIFPKRDIIFNNDSHHLKFLVSLKRKKIYENIYKYNEYYILKKKILNWEICLLLIKMFIKKRKKMYFDNYKSCMQEINFEFCFSPKKIFSLAEKQNPIHIKPEHIYTLFSKNYSYLTQKTDGIPIYERIDELKQIYNEKIYFEYIQEQNLCVINGDNINVINNLREHHPFIEKKNYDTLTIQNYRNIYKEYIYYDGSAFKKYLETPKEENCFEKLWWPKYVFKINSNNLREHIEILEYFSQQIEYLNKENSLDFIKNDGWILFSDNSEFDIYKIKPYKHLTIDLLYLNNLMYFNKNLECTYNFKLDFKIKEKLKNNTIYRCYFDESENIWYPSEERTDKFVPNKKEICDYLEKCHHNRWCFKDFKIITPYYHFDYSINISNSHSYFKKIFYSTIKELTNTYSDKNDIIIDLGCGFNFKNYRFKKTQKYIGFDCDYKILENNNKLDNTYFYIVDNTKKWDLESQINCFGKTYKFIPNINDFYNNFRCFKADILLSINSIHYFIENEYNNFFNNINSIARKGSVFIVRFLDFSKLEKKLKQKNTNCLYFFDSSFIKNEDYDNDNFSIYYSWSHKHPIKEKKISQNFLDKIMFENRWDNIRTIEPILEEYSSWEIYMNCFNICVYQKF